MTAVLTGVWGVCGVLWLVTAPRVLVAVAGAGPDRGYGLGWVLAAVSWLAFPVCVGIAIASLIGTRPSPVLGLLPLLAAVVFGVGLLVRRIGAAVLDARDRRRPPLPPPPPLRLADEAPARWPRPEFERLDDDARRAVLVDVGERTLAVWRAFLASTPGGTVSYPVRRPGRPNRRGTARRQVDDAVAYQALCDVRRRRGAARPRHTSAVLGEQIAAVRDGRLTVPYRATHALEALHGLHALEFGPAAADRRDVEWDVLEHAYAALP